LRFPWRRKFRGFSRNLKLPAKCLDRAAPDCADGARRLRQPAGAPRRKARLDHTLGGSYRSLTVLWLSMIAVTPRITV
jgi:hypothetical protein